MMATPLTDQQLVQHYINGEEKALETLLARHKNKVYTSIYFIVKNESLAEDIFQDTFFKVIKKLRSGDYKDEGKFLQWVLRIAHNLCIDHFRRQKRMPSFASADEEFDVFKMLRYNEPSADEKMALEHSSGVVRELIQQLPEDQRQVLVLRHYVDMSFKEISEMTGVSINTALGRMRYAILNMRKMIEEQQIAL
jgi:RNA polymerase sigma-70 factor (ECF subfamily)